MTERGIGNRKAHNSTSNLKGVVCKTNLLKTALQVSSVSAVLQKEYVDALDIRL